MSWWAYIWRAERLDDEMLGCLLSPVVQSRFDVSQCLVSIVSCPSRVQAQYYIVHNDGQFTGVLEARNRMSLSRWVLSNRNFAKIQSVAMIGRPKFILGVVIHCIR
jgi:hypothetical protein